MGKFDGKVALVTGSGQGIGKAIAIELARGGAKVALVTRTVSRAEDVKKEIEAFGGEAVAISCDVKEKDQVKNAVKATLDAFGTIDILVNNAQQFIWNKDFCDYTEDDMEMIFFSGYRASFWFMCEVFPIMKEKHYGKIINCASGAGIFGNIGTLAYASNKEAIRAMTRVAAKEWGKYGIRVNNYAPVAKTASMLPEQEEMIGALAPVGYCADSEEVARAVVFLASDDSSYITGNTLFIDGGCTIDTAR